MRIASLALIGLALVAVVAALWTIGGPGQARADRRDQIRMNDLHGLGRHLACLHEQGQGPEGRSPLCPGSAPRSDPLTAEPYRVELVSDGAVRVCATFEARSIAPRWAGGPRWADRDGFDPETGCLVLRPSAAG